jgi:hypothetical protein
VLTDFRDRLAQGDRADRLLDLALGRLKDSAKMSYRLVRCCAARHRTSPTRGDGPVLPPYPADGPAGPVAEYVNAHSESDWTNDR